MGMVCMTYLGMCMNGDGIGIHRTIMDRLLRRILLVRPLARTAFYGAAVGLVGHLDVVWLVAFESTLTFGAMTLLGFD